MPDGRRCIDAVSATAGSLDEAGPLCDAREQPTEKKIKQTLLTTATHRVNVASQRGLVVLCATGVDDDG